MRRVAAVLAALLLSLGLTTAVEAPAHAGWPGAEVSHAADDSGYIAAIIVLCEGDNHPVYLYRGMWSKNTGVCQDVNYIYVPDDGRVNVCFNPINQRFVYGPGYHALGNFDARKCYAQR